MSTKPRSKMKKAISIIGPLLILFLGSYLSFAHWSLSILAQELEKEITPTPTPTLKPTPTQTRVIFFGNPHADPVDRLTMGEVCKELGFSFETRDYRFVNDETKWFDADGQRRFHIIIFSGGHSEKWFENEVGPGINESGCQNIKKFISKGGSCWAICYSGASVFSGTAEFVEFMGTNQTVQVLGNMVKYCRGAPIFKGKVVGPQKSNRPYPRVRFLPIKLNIENPIVITLAIIKVTSGYKFQTAAYRTDFS